MGLLHEDESKTFDNERFISDLGHVIATDNIRKTRFGQRDGSPIFVQVRGWNAGGSSASLVQTQHGRPPGGSRPRRCE